LLPAPTHALDPTRAGHAPQYTLAKPDHAGRFELLLSEGGSFEIVGGVAGQTAAHQPIVLDKVRPHQEITLRLTPFVVVAGRVIDERGNACADVHVGLSPVGERTNLLSCLLSIEGIMPRGPTAADGTFRFLVPARGHYRLGYRPSPYLWAQGPQVQAPTEDALLVVREVDKQGFLVGGRVVAEATGVTVPKFDVYLVTHEAGGGFSDRQLTKGTDGTFFAADPLPIGQRYTLRIEAEGLGNAEVGPFDATVRREEVSVRMPALGSLVCTVLRADGTPAVKAHIGIEREGAGPFAPTPQGATDHDGRIRFTDLTPGDYTVNAYSAVGVAGAGTANGRVDVRPALEAALVLSLRQ